ncbi:aldehyde dehydrogenase family protein [Paracoccaceae bacterium Fryx2]|nr:aldehyde dehydrogenase family protein [Paracoccaceae bacterium Fryx2]
MPQDQALPRVTYSNIRADFSGVHALLDRMIPDARANLLDRDWAHHIGGAEVTGGRAYTVLCPIDRRLTLGRFHAADAALVDRAVTAAHKAQPAWAALPWQERVAAVRRFADELDARKYDLAVACLLEVGKSRMEAVGEAEEAVDLARYYCNQMEENEGFVRPLRRAFENEETSDRLLPVGVFAVIAPFNFPLALSVNMMSAALVAGNSVVYKPSDAAGLTGALLVRAAVAAGLPAGVVNMVCGDGATGQALADHPGIDGFAFTGSHKVGMGLLRAVAQGRHNRPVIAEMGGKNPTYVTRSADLDAAAEGVMRSAFGLQGQKCSAGSKVYVATEVREAFLAKLLERTAALRVGDPASADVFVGPVISKAALDRFAEACAEARRDGQVLAGGERLTGGLYDHGCYVAPTIVAGLGPDHRLNRDEVFLPFLTMQTFDDLATAIADGNDVLYGLTAGCYATDEAELAVFLRLAEAGALYANRASGATTGAWPGIQTFCGWKGSGVSGKGGLGPYYVQQFLREQSRTIWRG